MSGSTREEAMHGLIRACYSAGDDLGVLRARVLHELGKLVAYEGAFMAVSDPETLLFTAAFSDEPLAAAGPLFLDNEFGRQPDVNRFADLAANADPVASLDQATGGEWRSSPRWTEIMAPLGMGDEARVALRVEGTTWGFLCLHRTGAIPFDHRELATLRRAAPHIGEAIRQAVAAAGSTGRGADDVAAQGLIVVVDDHIAALGGAAEYWLEQLEGGSAAIGAPLPLPLLAPIRRLRVLERSAGSAPPAMIRLGTKHGSLVTVHATRLRDAGGTGPIVLTIAPAGSVERASMLLAAHGLTAAQRRVAQLVLQGQTTRQMVLALHISEHTVQDHLKAVFDKVGVRSRRDLVSAIMRPPVSHPAEPRNRWSTSSN
jgi:DNA-binding CsgD family transcriptional regulator